MREILVKLDHRHPDFPMLRQTPGSYGRWGRFIFVVNQPVDACDWWVVCEGVTATLQAPCPPNRKVLLTWEPPCRELPYQRAFLAQFDRVITCHRGIRHQDVHFEQQGQPWFVGRSFDQLIGSDPPPKTRALSIVTSNKTRFPGHRARLDLALRLKEHFGNDADLYGRGLRGFADKWDVLSTYRFSVAIENEVADDWMTEKLADCLLTTTHPFYAGCPNIGRYFDTTHAITTIDIEDYEGTIRVIERALADETRWEQSQEALLVARERYLREHQLFALLARILEPATQSGLPVQQNTIRPERANLVGRVSRRVSRLMSHSSDTDPAEVSETE